MNEIDIPRHKQQIKTDFNQRKNYDDRDFCHYYGNKLVGLAPLRSGDRGIWSNATAYFALAIK